MPYLPVPYIFQTRTSPIPLAELDADLANLSARAYNVDDYGAVGNYNPDTGVGTDDSAAIQAALTAAQAAGGGIVYLGRKKYKLGSALTIPINVTLQGHNAGGQSGWRDLGSTPWTNPPINPTDTGGIRMRTMTSSLWVCFDAGRGDGTATYAYADASALPDNSITARTAAIFVQGALRGVNLFQYSFNNALPATYTDNATFNSAWNSGTMSGVAIKFLAHGAAVTDCLIGGFMQAMCSTVQNQLQIRNITMDCMNGIQICNSLDGGNIENIQQILLASIGYSLSSLVRRGTFIYAYGTCDGLRFTNLFTFGHKHGIYFKSGVNICQVTNFGHDIGVERVAYYGIRLDQVVLATFSNVCVSGMEFGVHVTGTALTYNGTSISDLNTVNCNTGVYVVSGSLSLNAPNLSAAAAGTRVGINNAGSGNVRVYNPTYDGCVTGNIIGHVVQDLEWVANVKDYGAKGDGVTDDAVALQAAFATGNAYLPPGLYLCSAKLTISNKSVTLSGAGAGVSRLIFTATTGGILLSVRHTPGVADDQININNFSIEARAAVSSPGLDISYNNPSAVAYGSSWVSHMIVMGQYDNSGYFSDCIKATNIVGVYLNKCALMGNPGTLGGGAGCTIGINLTDAIHTHISDCDITFAKQGIKTRRVTADCEGLSLSEVNCVDCDLTLDLKDTISISLNGGFFGTKGSTTAANMTLDGCDQSQIVGALIHCSAATGPNNQDGIVLKGASSSITIDGNNIYCVTAGAKSRAAIRIQDSSIFNTIIGNTMLNHTVGIQTIAAGDTTNRFIGNELFCGTPIVDVGTLNYKRGNTYQGAEIADNSIMALPGPVGAPTAAGQIGSTSVYGTILRPALGSSEDLRLMDSAAVMVANTKSGSFRVAPYAVAGVPSAAVGGGVIYVTNETGGAVLAFSDGTNWRRVTDRAIIS